MVLKCLSQPELAQVEEERDAFKEKLRLTEKERDEYRSKYEKGQEMIKGRAFPRSLSPETVPDPAACRPKLILMKVPPTRNESAIPTPKNQDPRSLSPEPSLPYFRQTRNDLSLGRLQPATKRCDANTVSSTMFTKKPNAKSRS